MSTNVDRAEISKFSALAARWWDPAGEMGALHVINPARLRYIERACGGLRGKSALDVGCGGGLLSEALAEAGADVLGIDLAEASIEVARAHAQAQAQGLEVNYRVVAAEDLAVETPGRYDLVCCMEMLEHVPDPAQTVAACAQLLRPGGQLLLSTINRNAKSYALMIVAAEYLLGLVPRGTHDYGHFIRPSELERWTRQAGLETRDITGLRYDPLTRSARLQARDVDVNYLMHCHKPA